MSYVLYGIAVIVIACAIGFYGSRSSGLRRGSGKSFLKKIAQITGSRPKISAMCYVPAWPILTKYTCPVCGTVTNYPLQSEVNTVFAARQLERLMKQLQKDGKKPGWSIELDESQFCDKCNPGRKDPPKLTLIVTHKGREKPHRYEGVTIDDVRLIRDYVSGKDTHLDPSTNKILPIKDFYDRLNKLLGLTLKSDANSEKKQDE